MPDTQQEIARLQEIPIELERDGFLRDLIRELAGILEDVVGLDEAAGFISIVGQNIGLKLNQTYQNALQVESLNPAQVAATLVDLKRRIKGDFYIIEEQADKIILGNRACPFADKVKDRNSLCMMTSNVFGVIAAENLGYSKVSLDQTIAKGDQECRIVVHLTDPGMHVQGREYFKSD